MPSRSAICSRAAPPAAPSGPERSRSPNRITTSRRSSAEPSAGAGPSSSEASSRSPSASLPAKPASRSSSASSACGPRAAARPVAKAAACPGAKRSDSLAAGLQGGLGGHRLGQRQVVAAHALAQPQIEDRRVVDRVGREHQHGVGELEVADPGLQRRGAERTVQLERQGAAAAGVQVRGGEPSRISRASRWPSSLVAWPPAIAAARSPARRRPSAASVSARSQETGRSWPPSRSSGSVMRSAAWKD